MELDGALNVEADLHGERVVLGSLLLFVCLGVGGASCSGEGAIADNDLSSGTMELEALRPGYQLVRTFPDGVVGTPKENFERLVLKVEKSGQEIPVRGPKDLYRYVQIANAKAALQFVRLFTRPDSHYMFENVQRIELGSGGPEVQTIPPTLAHELDLREPKVSQLENGYQIVRFLLRPETATEPLAILRVTETVDARGRYERSEETVRAGKEKLSGVFYPVYQ